MFTIRLTAHSFCANVPGKACLSHCARVHLHPPRSRVARSPRDMIVDVGMPWIHENSRYNCRVFIQHGKILLIRPKLYLAMDGNYREGRWFARWMKRGKVEETVLPQIIREATGEDKVAFGDGLSPHRPRGQAIAPECHFVPVAMWLIAPELRVADLRIADTSVSSSVVVSSPANHHHCCLLLRPTLPNPRLFCHPAVCRLCSAFGHCDRG